MKRNDWLIICVGLVLAGLVYLVMMFYKQLNQSELKSIQVYIDGELQEQFQVSDYGQHRYETDYGYNIIEINEEGASIIEANCPDLSCTRQSPIIHSGESIVCLPHHFHIEVKSNEGVEIDAISQ